MDILLTYYLANVYTLDILMAKVLLSMPDALAMDLDIYLKRYHYKRSPYLAELVRSALYANNVNQINKIITNPITGRPLGDGGRIIKGGQTVEIPKYKLCGICHVNREVCRHASES